MCAAAELERRYERIFGYLHDDLSRKLPSLGLALSVLLPSGTDRLHARTVLAPAAPLRRWRLIDVKDGEASTPRLAKPMGLDERVLAYVLGDTREDARIAEALSPPGAPASILPTTPRRTADRARLRQLVNGWDGGSQAGSRPLLYLFGPPSCGAEDVVREMAAELGMAVLSANLQSLTHGAHDVSEALLLVFREALLRQAILVLRDGESMLDGDHGGTGQRTLE
ncbi:MAG: hypothetical protein ACK5QW_10090, partial [Cyanobacteriota bacterium]